MVRDAAQTRLLTMRVLCRSRTRAFSSEVGTGSREENASKQSEYWLLISRFRRDFNEGKKGKKMGGLVYGGKFEQTVNDHFSHKNIAETAKKFKEMEQKHGPYSFGQMMKQMVPKAEDYP